MNVRCILGLLLLLLLLLSRVSVLNAAEKTNKKAGNERVFISPTSKLSYMKATSDYVVVTLVTGAESGIVNFKLSFHILVLPCFFFFSSSSFHSSIHSVLFTLFIILVYFNIQYQDMPQER